MQLKLPAITVKASCSNIQQNEAADTMRNKNKVQKKGNEVQSNWTVTLPLKVKLWKSFYRKHFYHLRTSVGINYCIDRCLTGQRGLWRSLAHSLQKEKISSHLESLWVTTTNLRVSDLFQVLSNGGKSFVRCLYLPVQLCAAHFSKIHKIQK